MTGIAAVGFHVIWARRRLYQGEEAGVVAHDEEPCGADVLHVSYTAVRAWSGRLSDRHSLHRLELDLFRHDRGDRGVLVHDPAGKLVEESETVRRLLTP